MKYLIFLTLLIVGCETMSPEERENFGKNNPDTTYTYYRNLSNSRYNPCKDTSFLKLKSLNIDSLSDRQYQYFIMKEKECSEYTKMVLQINPQNKIADQYESNSQIWVTLLVISGLASLVVLLIAAGQSSP